MLWIQIFKALFVDFEKKKKRSISAIAKHVHMSKEGIHKVLVMTEKMFLKTTVDDLVQPINAVLLIYM